MDARGEKSLKKKKKNVFNFPHNWHVGFMDNFLFLFWGFMYHLTDKTVVCKNSTYDFDIRKKKLKKSSAAVLSFLEMLIQGLY